MIADDRYYVRRAQQELDLAAAAADRSVKALHLNVAVRYASMREPNSDARHEVESPNTCRDLPNETTRLGSPEMWP